MGQMQAKQPIFDRLIVDLLVLILSVFLGIFSDKTPWFSFRKFLVDDPQSLYGAVAGIQGSLLGFVLAALAIILGYSSAPQLRILRESGQLSNLFQVYMAGIKSHAVGAGVALLALAVKPALHLTSILAWSVALILVLSSVRLLRTLWATNCIVKSVSQCLNDEGPA